MGSAGHTTAVGTYVLESSSLGTQLAPCAGRLSYQYEPGMCAIDGGCGFGIRGIASGTLVSARYSYHWYIRLTLSIH